MTVSTDEMEALYHAWKEKHTQGLPAATEHDALSHAITQGLADLDRRIQAQRAGLEETHGKGGRYTGQHATRENE